MAPGMAERDASGVAPPEGSLMPHLLDPAALSTEQSYVAARRELDALLCDEPLDTAGTRLGELVELIEDYEARRDGYDLAHVKRLLAGG